MQDKLTMTREQMRTGVEVSNAGKKNEGKHKRWRRGTRKRSKEQNFFLVRVSMERETGV